MLTYQLPEKIREIAEQGEFCEFDLNEFFRAEDDIFINEDYVQKWVDLIHGAYAENVVSELKLAGEKPPMPFSRCDSFRCGFQCPLVFCPWGVHIPQNLP